MFEADVKFAADELKKLVGGKITDTVMTKDNENYGFVVEAEDGTKKVCWVDCDPEGNGPGFISIQEKTDEKGQ